MTLPRTKKLTLTTVAAATLLLSACGGSDEGDDTTPTPSPEAADETASEEGSGSYSAGDYSAEGSYQTPGGTQSVVVDLTLEEDGTVSAVTVEPQADGGNSEQFQTKFAGGIADKVVGVKIDDLNVSKVSGSSLTSGGFNAAVDEIKAEAAA